jgi:DNA helicase-2/ATP-dependent DNA helicase PcrA
MLLTVEYKNNQEVEYSRFIKEIETFANRSKQRNSFIPLDIDCIVRHKKFGLGIVKGIKDSYITIYFNERGLKELSVDMCMRRNLLETVKLND